MPALGIEIPAAVERHLLALARAARPREACGLLLGVRAGVVTEAVELANVAPGLDRFELDPGGFVRAAGDARARALRVLGVWHSHPAGPATPSAADLAGALRGERGWSHAIVGPAGGGDALESYRLAGERLVREPVRRPNDEPARALEAAR
jgi:proteasome lid subunit RPN8/RPN11